VSPGPDAPPHVGRRLLVRAAIAGVLVVLLSAAAVASAGLLEIKDITDTYVKAAGRDPIAIPEISRAEAGGPRTFLILGSDQRYIGTKLDKKPRSDTMLLVRVDPRTDGIAVMSIPRDLAVDIPGYGRDKINAAYSEGGPRKTVATIKALFRGATGRDFPINHVINVNFGGFRRAVDYIGGVYVDVDRRYFNDNNPPVDSPTNYATIDVQPGYQKLKGQDALDYVRYRHGDNDLVRAARQQDFIRQLTHQAGVRKLLNFDQRKRLVRIFARYFDVDRSFLSAKTILSLLRTAIYLTNSNARVHEVHFQVSEAADPALDSNLYASAQQLRSTLKQFLRAKTPTPAAGGAGAAKAKPARKGGAARRARRAPTKGLEDARAQGEDYAVIADPKLSFPFYFPALRLAGSSYSTVGPRLYHLRDELGRKHAAYRLVLYHGFGEYYGVQGTTWRTPPILDAPDETRKVGHRRLQLFYDGKRVRIVAWRTRRAVYWVSNTLTQTLTKGEMIGIAASLRRLKQ
jgi:polyisoprenyl-teichoic acid--peptidoglycan teichoic acid transferase